VVLEISERKGGVVWDSEGGWENNVIEPVGYLGMVAFEKDAN